MRPDDDMLPSLRAVGEQLHEAARRETAPARRRRRRRRALAATVAILLLAAAVAAAARLIAVGGPVADRHGQPAGLVPRAPGRIVVEAHDPAGGLPWAARAYTSRDGHDCVLAGLARGFSLGVVHRQVFRPYAGDTRGACGDLRRFGLVVAVQTFTEPHLRTIVFGRVRPGVSDLRVVGPGGTKQVTPAEEGAFLLVYEGRVRTNQVRVEPE